MERRSCPLRWPALSALLGLLTAAAAGCTVLQSAAFLIKGTDTPAEYDGLNNKKVAVVCRMINMVDLSNSSTARSLSEAICQRLKANEKSIHLIEPQKIASLVDVKGIDDPLRIGKELKADKVLAIDIESFSLREGPTLLRGQSIVTINVYDVATKDLSWHKRPKKFEYPSYGPEPAQEIGEGEFRNQFIDSLADQIGRNFYPHDRYAQKLDTSE